MVGERFGFGGYKNGALAFRALAAMPGDTCPILVCVGGQKDIEAPLRDLAPRVDVRRLTLDDSELRAAYGGALALLYPSKYEGFGMPPIESMACGTPAIVCRNSSLPEVVGDAALFVDENDPAELAAAILKLEDPATRADLVERGSRQAATFTFAAMADATAKALLETHRRVTEGRAPRPNPIWTELRGFQQGCQAMNVGVSVAEQSGDATASAIRFVAGPALEEALRTIENMRLSRSGRLARWRCG